MTKPDHGGRGVTAWTTAVRWIGVRRVSTVSCVVVTVMLGAAACTRAKAKTAPTAPPGLDMPAPPPRDIETNEAEAPQPVPLPQEPARSAPPRRPQPAAPRPAEPKA